MFFKGSRGFSIMKDVLKNYFGYDEFRPLQEDIVKSVLSGRDVFVHMATGMGKSICFQVPALMLPGVTLVISPLIALMKDQVDSLNANGVAAEYINSSLKDGEIRDIMDRVKDDEVKLLYIAPERFSSEQFCNFLKEVQVSLIAIDEAHCISTWGHDFRKDYRNLNKLRTKFPGVPIIALTATATEKVKRDIISQLRLTDEEVFVSSFDRENLSYHVKSKTNSFSKLVDVLTDHRGEPSIVYCFSRKDCMKISKKLNLMRFRSVPYHAGLPQKTREKNQEKFINDKVDIVVATIAFGMGIDKPDVRLVVHYTFPKSVEGYYQEIGRAGRDGLESDCVMFYSKRDAFNHEFFIRKLYGEDAKRAAKVKLNEMIGYCEDLKCRRKFLLGYFGEDYANENCGNCDVCLGTVEKVPRKRRLEFDAVLLERLKRLRNDVAAREGVAPFVILGDVALRKMAGSMPKTRSDLLKVPGFSASKVRNFGEQFLVLARRYVAERERLG
jgi:ATP-dependent DNA helicase RecQ